MAVLSHEGTYPIMYGSLPLPIGTAHSTGYLARPDEAGKFPVVLMLPGLRGMGPFERDTCRRLARSGLAALTLDLYRPGEDPLAAYAAFTDSRGMTCLDEVQDFIVSDDVDWNVSESLGLLGTDIGGRYALIAAATRPWVRSVAVAYTPVTGDEERDFPVAGYLEHLPVPVLGLYGAEDELIDLSSVDEAQRRNEHGRWLLYEGAGHDFLDITSDGYHPGAADDAFARLVSFFQDTLDSAIVEDLG